jgi:hypothetical protein
MNIDRLGHIYMVLKGLHILADMGLRKAQDMALVCMVAQHMVLGMVCFEVHMLVCMGLVDKLACMVGKQVVRSSHCQNDCSGSYPRTIVMTHLKKATRLIFLVVFSLKTPCV